MTTPSCQIWAKKGSGFLLKDNYFVTHRYSTTHNIIAMCHIINRIFEGIAYQFLPCIVLFLDGFLLIVLYIAKFFIKKLENFCFSLESKKNMLYNTISIL